MHCLHGIRSLAPGLSAWSTWCLSHPTHVCWDGATSKETRAPQRCSRLESAETTTLSSATVRARFNAMTSGVADLSRRYPSQALQLLRVTMGACRVALQALPPSEITKSLYLHCAIGLRQALCDIIQVSVEQGKQQRHPHGLSPSTLKRIAHLVDKGRHSQAAAQLCSRGIHDRTVETHEKVWGNCSRQRLRTSPRQQPSHPLSPKSKLKNCRYAKNCSPRRKDWHRAPRGFEWNTSGRSWKTKAHY